MTVIWLYLTTLPFGYWMASKVFPEKNLSPRDFALFVIFTVLWPITLMALIQEKFER